MAKYYPRLGVTKNSTGTFKFYHSDGSAWSYDWWQFIKTLPNGMIVYNNYRYSQSTCKHQLSGLRVVNYHTDIDVSVPGGLQLANWVDVAIANKKADIYELNQLINKKGTRKAKNAERKELIAKLANDIKVLTDLAKQVA